MSTPSVQRFRNIVWAHYCQQGRHDLPWRKTKDPYKILVSEVMLQQTQVERVIPYYKKWMEQFPNVKALAAAPLGDVLRAWQGLGYNRRAKMLHAAAQEVVTTHKGKMPETVEELVALPGVGPYTARAVVTFSQNKDEVFIETNLRTVVMHHFFLNREKGSDKKGGAGKKISDAQILEVLAKALPRGRSREWYWALMDYGSFLKRSGVRINAKSKSYTKQSKFSGSDREARGALLKELTKGEQTRVRLTGVLGDDRTDQVQAQLQKLIVEGMVEKASGSRFRLPL